MHSEFFRIVPFPIIPSNTIRLCFPVRYSGKFVTFEAFDYVRPTTVFWVKKNNNTWLKIRQIELNYIGMYDAFDCYLLEMIGRGTVLKN